VGGSCEDSVPADSEESGKRPIHFAELEALLKEKNLEPSLKRRAVFQTRHFSDKEEAVLQRQRAMPSVAKKSPCHAEQVCNPTEDTCCCFCIAPRD